MDTKLVDQLKLLAKESNNRGYPEETVYGQAADLIERQAREIEGRLDGMSDEAKEIVSSLREMAEDNVEARICERKEDCTEWGAANCIESLSVAHLSLCETLDAIPQTSLAEVRASAIEGFIDNELRSSCLANGWGTDSSAYEVHLMLNDYANKIRNGKDG